MTLTRLEKTTFGFLGILFSLGVVLLFIQKGAAQKKNVLIEDDIRKVQELTPRTILKKSDKPAESYEDIANKVNVNSADVKALDEVPGVGKVMAERIVEFRTKQGQIKDLAELSGVEGMSSKKLSTLSKYLTVSGGSSQGQPKKKLNLNFATLEEIDTLPGVGKNVANAIIETRNQKGGFKSLDDLQEVPGLTEAAYNKFADLIEVR